MSHGTPSDSKATSTAAFITFFKSLFGAGVLALPNVFGEVRLVIGCVTYLAITIGCAGTCYLLLKAREIAMEHIINNDNTQGHRKKKKKKQKDDDDEEEEKEENGSGNHKYHDEEIGKKGSQQTEKIELVTYGDLASVLFNPFMADLTRWTIIILNFLFTSGIIIVICVNMTNVFDDAVSRHTVGLVILPIVVFLVQLPWLQDMFFISFLGLVVYGVGVMGSTFFSAYLFFEAPQTSPPDDLWDFKWSNLPSFAGSAMYALEGINLALPTVYSMENQQQGIMVVCSSLFLYGILTLTFAAVGYAGGLGGKHCDVVTQCIHPPWLKVVIQIALSIAMVLSVPIMLYPTTEMLEIMITDWKKNRRSKQMTQRRRSMQAEISLNDFRKKNYHSTNPQSNETDYRRTSESSKEHSPSKNTGGGEVQEKSITLRFLLAFLTVMVGAFTPSFSLFSAFVGAIGLTFAGFVLPPFIYIRAMQKSGQEISWGMWILLSLVVMFGLWNMVVGGYKSGVDLFTYVF